MILHVQGPVLQPLKTVVMDIRYCPGPSSAPLLPTPALHPCSSPAQAEASDPTCRLCTSLTPQEGSPRLKLWAQTKLSLLLSHPHGLVPASEPWCLPCSHNCLMVLLNIYRAPANSGPSNRHISWLLPCSCCPSPRERSSRLVADAPLFR